MVRGYDEIKLRNVGLYHEQINRLRPQLTGRPGNLPLQDVAG